MAQYWQPTAASYTGRVSKGLILEAVAESPGEGAGKISALKKDAMADVPGIYAPARVSVALFSARPLLFRADGQSRTWLAPFSGRPIPSFNLRFYSLIHEKASLIC
jgi:hypothetical protein